MKCCNPEKLANTACHEPVYCVGVGLFEMPVCPVHLKGWMNSYFRNKVNIFFNSFQVQCCPDRIFPCLQCHNETSNHKAQEKAIQALVCQYCNNVQRDIINHCVQCNNQFSQVRLLILWSTMPSKNMNLPYSIHMYWTNIWQPTVHVCHSVLEALLKPRFKIKTNFSWHIFAKYYYIQWSPNQ